MQTLSFYKIFGYPCGLGALVVKRDVLPLLQKRYFGGGAVAAVAADDNFHRYVWSHGCQEMLHRLGEALEQMD